MEILIAFFLTFTDYQKNIEMAQQIDVLLDQRRSIKHILRLKQKKRRLNVRGISLSETPARTVQSKRRPIVLCLKYAPVSPALSKSPT